MREIAAPATVTVSVSGTVLATVALGTILASAHACTIGTLLAYYLGPVNDNGIELTDAARSASNANREGTRSGVDTSLSANGCTKFQCAGGSVCVGIDSWHPQK